MLNDIKHLIMDMDGVLWRGETSMPGLATFFATLQREGIDFILATNNATKTAELYTQKLAHFGIDIEAELILTSAETTAQYLSERYERGTAVYIVGARGLHDAFRAHDFAIVTPAEVERGGTAPLVVAGFTPTVTYHDMAMATLLINRGATFYGTNPDPSFPSEQGDIPGTGALLAFIGTAAGVTPMTFGKPGPIMYEQALQRLGGTKANTAMVGDRLSTDIAGAVAAGLRSILVLTGISSREDISDSPYKPDFVFEDITELAAALSRVPAAR